MELNLDFFFKAVNSNFLILHAASSLLFPAVAIKNLNKFKGTF